MPGCYLKAGRGYQPDSAHAGSPGQSPLSFPHSRRFTRAPSGTSPLQPSQSPARPLADTADDTVDGASGAASPPGSRDQGDEVAEGRGHAAFDEIPQHVSSNGVQHGEDVSLSGLNLGDTRAEDTQQSEENDKTSRDQLGPDSPVAQEHRQSTQSSSPDQKGSHSGARHAEGAPNAAELSLEPTQAASSTEGEPVADSASEADVAASSAPAEAQLVAVAERAEHAAAAVAAEGLELDRSSEPAAMAAARSGSLAPGDSSHAGRSEVVPLMSTLTFCCMIR